jgi:hypothetical protein
MLPVILVSLVSLSVNESSVDEKLSRVQATASAAAVITASVTTHR